MWKQVIAPTALVSLLWIAVSVPSTFYLNRLFDAHSQAMSENMGRVEAAWAMRRDTWRLQVAVMEAAMGDTGSSLDEIRQTETSFLDALATARATVQGDAAEALVEQIEQRFAAFREHLQAHVPNPAGERSALTAEQRQRMQELGMQVTQACRELLDLNERMVMEQAARNERMYTSVVVARLGFLVVAPAVGLLLGWWVARRLNRSISQISVNLRDATGKLGPELGSVAVTSTDELPALERQVQVVADRIRRVVGELEHTRQRALQAERLAAVGELAAGVAHEVRNPLTSVKLLIQTASQRQPSQPLGEKQTEVVLQEISRIEAMIQGLLDFARPPRLRPVLHDLRQTVRRALNLVQGRADHQKVTIVEDLPDRPVMIHGDPEQLHLVFGNLAINAVEAMSGGGTLNVALSNGDGACRVRFLDTGPGISPTILDRLFEPFVTSKERGTGLGLAISRRIVLEHGGVLSAVNRPQGGAEFTVELRAQDALIESAAPAHRTDGAAAGAYVHASQEG